MVLFRVSLVQQLNPHCCDTCYFGFHGDMMWSLPAMQDFRYMATSDLTELLRKPEWRRDDDTEKRLCELILAQLDDSSGDVSSLAVKWCCRLA